MTVDSGVIKGGIIANVRSRAQFQVLGEKTRQAALIFRLNLALLIATILIMAGQVFLSNFLVAQKYTLSVRETEFYRLNTAIAARKEEAGDGLRETLSFIQRSGMVEGKDADMLVLDRNFALRK